MYTVAKGVTEQKGTFSVGTCREEKHGTRKKVSIKMKARAQTKDEKVGESDKEHGVHTSGLRQDVQGHMEVAQGGLGAEGGYSVNADNANLGFTFGAASLAGQDRRAP